MKRISTPALISSLGLLAISLLLALPSVAWPLEILQQRSLQLAADWSRDLLPLRGGGEVRTPGITFIYLLAQMVFGAQRWGIRVFELVIVLASARTATQAAVRRKITLVEYAPVAVFCTASYFTFVDPIDSAREQTWAAICILAAQAVIARDRNRRRAAMVGGLWCGSALVLQPSTALFIPLLFGQLLYLGLKDRPEPERGPTLVEIPAAFLFGAAQPPFFFASYFFSHKAAGPFYRLVMQVLESHGGWPPAPPTWWPLVLALALWAFALVQRLRTEGLAASWPSGVTLLFLGCSILAARGDGSWVLVLPALWICAADGVVALSALGRPGKVLPAIATCVCAAILVALSPNWRSDHLRTYRERAIEFYAGR